jgi:hypothetical protein
MTFLRFSTLVRESQPPSPDVNGSAPIVRFCVVTTQVWCTMYAVDGRHGERWTDGRTHDKELLSM